MKESVGDPWVNATYTDVALHPLSAAEHHALKDQGQPICTIAQ